MSLFKPRRVVPNTLDPALKGLDAACIQKMFAGCLAEDALADPGVSTAAPTDLGDIHAAVRGGSELVEDVAFKNLEGEGARELAEKWADSGRMKRKLLIMKEFLPAPHRKVVEQILQGRYRPSSKHAPVKHVPVDIPKPPRMGAGSGSETEPMSSSPPPVPAPLRRGIQGRATLEQTKAAMARLSSSSSSSYAVPKALRSPSVDSDSDDEGKHELMAQLFFGDETTVPPTKAMYAERTSSPLPEEPAAGSSRLARLPSLPLTPRSKAASQDLSHWLRSSSPASADRERPVTPEPCLHTQDAGMTDESDQPHTPRRATLHLPIQPSTARKGKRIAIPTPDTHTRRPVALFKEERPPMPCTPPTSSLAPAAVIVSRHTERKKASPQAQNSTASEDANSSPLLNLRNLRKRPGSPDDPEETDHHAAPPPSLKRRRVNDNLGGSPPRARSDAIAQARRQDNATAILAAASSSRRGAQPEGAQRASVSAVAVASLLPNGGSGSRSIVQSVAVTATATMDAAARPAPATVSAATVVGKSTARFKLKGKSQQEALKIAEQLAKAAPDLVTPECKAKIQRRRLREEAKQAHGASAIIASANGSASNLHLGVTASASTSAAKSASSKVKAVDKTGIASRLPSQDEEMDPEAAARTRELEATIKQGLARGLRPGLVIPRLQCLESQEEEE